MLVLGEEEGGLTCRRINIYIRIQVYPQFSFTFLSSSFQFLHNFISKKYLLLLVFLFLLKDQEIEKEKKNIFPKKKMSLQEKGTSREDKDGLFANSSSASSINKKTVDPSFNSENVESQREEGEHGNILSQYTEKQVMQMGRNYALKHDLDPVLFANAAALARAPSAFNSMPFLSEEEKQGLYLEATKKWHIPRKLFACIALGSMAAVIQGMDETVVNGATLFYPRAMGIDQMANPDLLEGLINSAPYLCASCIACWQTDLWNRYLGRKWTIFWTCVISAVTCIWQGFVSVHWWHLFLARFFLGFGIGIKSATVPVYCAECSPKHIRGALVMTWQFFTAFGVCFLSSTFFLLLVYKY